MQCSLVTNSREKQYDTCVTKFPVTLQQASKASTRSSGGLTGFGAGEVNAKRERKPRETDTEMTERRERDRKSE